MRKFEPQQQRFDTFNDLVNAATREYTLSFREACQSLKCSRSWATKYIRPHVPSIYLPNGKGTGKVNYAKLVSALVNQRNGEEEEGYSNESIYLHKKAFNEFIFGSITSCQKRSKKVYKTFFVEKNRIVEYYQELLDMYYRLESAKSSKDAEKIWQRMERLYLEYATNNHVEIIHDSIVFPTKRTEAEFVDVPVPNVPIKEWEAVHDLMDYGDVEETIYRRLFRWGYIRVEIKLPDKYGEIKENGKIY